MQSRVIQLAVVVCGLSAAVALARAAEQPPSSRLAWLRAQRNQRQSPAAAAPSTTSSTTRAPPAVPLAAQGTAVEVEPPAGRPAVAPAAANRTVRTAEIFKNGDGFNIFVTNTCERESMRVNVRLSRPFYGIIHAQSQRQKAACSAEGNGETEYNLDISHVLNEKEPNYCGVVRARKESAEDKDLLSLVLAVRVHRNIELPDDKFFLLNCTNRCRRPDCSGGAARLTGEPGAAGEVEGPSGEREAAGPGSERGRERAGAEPEECTVWRFPWLITLLWCMGILLLALLISHCIVCSSMVCRCVKTEVEERAPSVYEEDCDDDRLYNKRHPNRIDYDNRDIYKTANNYAPYSLEEAQQKSRDRRHKRSDR